MTEVVALPEEHVMAPTACSSKGVGEQEEEKRKRIEEEIRTWRSLGTDGAGMENLPRAVNA